MKTNHLVVLVDIVLLLAGLTGIVLVLGAVLRWW